MKILIVEDEPSLRELIQCSLEKERYVVETASDFNSALRKIEDYDYDCILLDIMLPDGSGLDLLERLKALHKRENVIIISAKDSLEDKVLGLELGADDYLPKPFHLVELNARIKSVIRRHQHDGEIDIRQGNVRIEPDKYRVFVNEQEVELNRKEYDILLYFINRPGRLINKNTLAESVWGDHIDQVDNTLEGILLTDGQLDGHTVGVQTIMEHLNATVEIGTHGVHLVDVHHAGNLVLVSLTPNGLRLRLNTALGGQNGNGTVQNTQRTLNLNSEVNVTRGVDDVDTMAVLLKESRIVLGLGMAPIAGGSSGSDGDTTLLLLFHPVHRSSAVMNLTDLMVDTGVVQDALGRRRLAGIDMRHDTDVSGSFQWVFSRHGILLKLLLFPV